MHEATIAPSSISVPGSGTTLSTTSSPWMAMFAGRPSIVPLVLVPRLPVIRVGVDQRCTCRVRRWPTDVKLKSANCWPLSTNGPEGM